jgi:hypothetical protein
MKMHLGTQYISYNYIRCSPVVAQVQAARMWIHLIQHPRRPQVLTALRLVLPGRVAARALPGHLQDAILNHLPHLAAARMQFHNSKGRSNDTVAQSMEAPPKTSSYPHAPVSM